MQVINITSLYVDEEQVVVLFNDYPVKITVVTRRKLAPSEIVPTVGRALRLENEHRAANGRPTLQEETTEKINKHLDDARKFFPDIFR